MEQLICKICKSNLEEQENNFICNNCEISYNNIDGILVIEGNNYKNLYMPDKLLNLHDIVNKRTLHKKYINSNVEYVMRRYSVTFSYLHSKLLAPYIQNKIIVDLGGGQLPYINSIEPRYKKYYALDLDINALINAKNNALNKDKIYFIQHGVFNTPFKDSSVDIVISSEVIEHLEEPNEYLREVNRILKPDGILSISTPCSSIYFYPEMPLVFIKSPLKWIKNLYSHKNWKEVLKDHPALQPRILRKWLKGYDFKVQKHKTTLIYFHNFIGIIYKSFLFFEKIGFKNSYKIFEKIIYLSEKILSKNIPLIKWLGIRQFVICKKVSK